MSSKTQLCNMALSRLGAATLTNIETDSTAEAKLCNTLFSDLADRVMVQGSWTTTMTRVALVKTTTTPAFGFASEFQLPVDPKCLKVVTVNDVAPGDIEHVIEGDKLLTDESSIKIRYIARLTDTDSWGPLLSEAFEILLTSYLAMPITGDKALVRELRLEYDNVLSNNIAVDNQQGSHQVVTATDLIEVR